MYHFQQMLLEFLNIHMKIKSKYGALKYNSK